jgi:hypothetical protein
MHREEMAVLDTTIDSAKADWSVFIIHQFPISDLKIRNTSKGFTLLCFFFCSALYK